MGAITDVGGIRVGHHQRIDPGVELGSGWASGTTVVLTPPGTVGGVDGRGGAPGTRETDLLDPINSVRHVDAVVISGGSAYGLAAADGVMTWLEARDRGVAMAGGVVPIVPAAVVFDLTPLGRFDARPTADMAYAATDSARSAGIAEGAVGAGTGTTVGKIGGPALVMKGGVGLAVEGDADNGVAAFALAVVNAFGDVRDASGRIIAGARRGDGEGGFLDTLATLGRASTKAGSELERLALRNTTLAVVGMNRAMSSAELTALARAATAAFYRRITPCGTAFDGDIVFAVAPTAGEPLDAPPAAAGVLAAAALERALERAVVLARGREGIPGIADTNGH